MVDKDGETITDGRRLRGKRREAAVVDAARMLFLERGYKGTTLEAIVAIAGGSRETIYRAFGGKRGLLSAVIARVGDPIVASVDESGSANPRQVLRTFALNLMNFWRSPEGRIMNAMVFSEGLEAPEIIETWHESAVKPSLEALTNYLESQAGGDDLRISHVETAARQFLLLLMAEATFTSIVETDFPTSANTIVDRTIDLLLKR